jgi:hypothetical protein
MSNEDRDQAVDTTPDEATRRFEGKDAQREASAGRMPTPDEEAAAARADVSPEAAESYKEYLEKAKNVEGEGRIP